MKFKRRSTGSKTRLLSREQLAIWLDALDPPAAGISAIDGFLAAMAVSPRFIEPEAWMVTILGERASNVLEGTRMAAAIRTILARYEQICDELAESPETYAPVYMRTDDGEVLLEEFANGFFTGVRLALDAWTPFVSDPEIGYPLAMLVGHSSQTGGPSWIDQLADPAAKDALADAWRVVPDIILMVHDRCYEARTDSMIPADLFNPS